MRYGVPYLGSKNQIAKWVVDNLPKAEYFVDLFCGGCAVTHRALISGKYRRFIINDIDGRMPKLFLDAVHGKYTVENHPEWVSREEFHRLKDSDAYVAMIWSFGNNGKTYIYGADIEEYKHAYHLAVFNNDLKPFADLGINLALSDKKAVYDRYADYRRQLQRIYGAGGEVRNEQLERLQTVENVQNLQNLQSLQRLQSLQSLQNLQNLQNLQRDYSEVAIPKGAVIYCDPPYKGTKCGKYDGFDSGRFHEWARRQDNIFISEYSMPDDFIVIAECEKTILSAPNGNSTKATERLYTNEKTYRHMTDRQKRIIALNTAQQLTIMDFLGKEDGA